MRFASRSSTKTAALVAAAGFGTVAAILYASSDVTQLGALRLLAAIAAAVLVALYLILAQRERHQQIEDELAGQASFLEALIESMHAIAARGGPYAVLERARAEAERLFDAHARVRQASRARGGKHNIKAQDEPDVLGIFVYLPKVV